MWHRAPWPSYWHRAAYKDPDLLQDASMFGVRGLLSSVNDKFKTVRIWEYHMEQMLPCNHLRLAPCCDW